MLPYSVVFVIPSLDVGGMERVMSEITNYFAEKKLANQVHLIVLTKKRINFQINDKVLIHEPDFDYQNYSRIVFTFKTIKYLRKKIKQIKPKVVLSFGDRFNAFVIVSASFLKTNVYVSNRMNPLLSNGFIIDVLNKVFYRFATGIIAQTNYAKEVFVKRYGNKNVKVIPNPIKQSFLKGKKKENIILNVGRLVEGKNQNLLIEYFSKIKNVDWKIIFLGNGKNLKALEELVKEKGLKENIEFLGNVNDIENYYNRSKIFAFTSSTEGFPNVLGEAMAAKLACISFDCITGPSELIDDNENGFLIPLFNDEVYLEKLNLLMNDDKLREKFRESAFQKMKKFNIDKICQQYYDLFINQ